MSGTPARRSPTATSSFGVSRRESHDSSGFYARFTPPRLDHTSEPWEGSRAIDKVFDHDARSMDEIPDGSVALVVTSPPYFAGKEYEEALGEGHVPGSYLEYLGMLEEVFRVCVDKLEPGGRIAVNVANLGRRPYRSLSSDVVAILQDKLQLLLRGEILWQKARGAAANCAWGSFQRPANPVLRDVSERIVVASKGRFDRALTARQRHRRGLPSEASMWREDFMEYTTDVWEMPAESAQRVGHPAPFPVELPERLIHLYTYYGDLVLDPFMGVGTTAVAAIRAGRHFAGYETERAYVDAADARIEAEGARLRPVELPPVVLPAVAAGAALGADPVASAVREGRTAKEVARALLASRGFAGLEEDVRCPGGQEVSFRAHDTAGRRWLFDVCGGLTSHRPGLKRADVLWKALAKAAVLKESGAGPLVLLTADLPAGPAATALRALWGPGRPVHDVIRMLDPADQHRLGRLLSD